MGVAVVLALELKRPKGVGRGSWASGVLGKGRSPDLLHVVDLIMLALLVASYLALRLLGQLTQVLLRVLLYSIFHCLGQCQPVLIYPFVQSPVNC